MTTPVHAGSLPREHQLGRILGAGTIPIIAEPLCGFLGTAPERNKMIVYDAGHLVPSSEFINETLASLDTYVGPVN
jgi:hypothetical protein